MQGRKTKFTDITYLHRNLTDLELGLYVRGGSIVPILEHKRELSLLRAIDNPISLHVYLDDASSASGKLMLDDGLSTKPDKLVTAFNYSETGKSGILQKETTKQTYKSDKAIT